jgi:glycosyltransferase involved in cell wall biosynthesis
MEKQVKVSICCITYNHVRFIRQCIEGFLMQKMSFEYEILIHDDASTDGTTDIVKEYAAKYPDKIIPLIQTENKYSSETRAIATTYLLPKAKGQYIALCEGDDYWTNPLKLQKQVELLDAYPEVAVCTHASALLYKNGKKKLVRKYDGSRFADKADVIRWKHLYWPIASFVYRKDLMENYPGFCLDCHAGDVALFYYLNTKGETYYLDEVMSVYRCAVPGSHSERFKEAGDVLRQQMVQSEFDLIDGINALTGFSYNTLFIGKKMILQSNILARRKRYGRMLTYNGFFDDLSHLSLSKRFVLLFKIYVLPVLRGNMFVK